MDTGEGALAHPGFADFLSAHRPEIIQQWLMAVQGESHITAAAHLPVPALTNHLPQLFDHLCDLLRSAQGDELPDSVCEKARAHGGLRFRQGYRLEEALWELALLRTVFLKHIAIFDAANEGISSEMRTLAQIRLHRFFDDIARRSADCFVESQQATLRSANEAHSELMRTLAHEIRNVLNALGLAATEISRGTPAVGNALLELIRQSTQHLQALLDEFLEHSALAAGQIRVFPTAFLPAGLARQIEIALRPLAAQKGLELVLRIDPDLKEVVGDELKTRQIILNLLTNAIKFTATGRVRLEMSALGSERWLIEVSDTGVGIAPEEQTRIFSDYYRVSSDAPKHGIGLGLSIVSRLTEVVGGTLHLESTPGVGSVFKVSLPRQLHRLQMAPEPKPGPSSASDAETATQKRGKFS